MALSTNTKQTLLQEFPLAGFHPLLSKEMAYNPEETFTCYTPVLYDNDEICQLSQWFYLKFMIVWIHFPVCHFYLGPFDVDFPSNLESNGTI